MLSHTVRPASSSFNKLQNWQLCNIVPRTPCTSPHCNASKNALYLHFSWNVMIYITNLLLYCHQPWGSGIHSISALRASEGPAVGEHGDPAYAAGAAAQSPSGQSSIYGWGLDLEAQLRHTVTYSQGWFWRLCLFLRACQCISNVWLIILLHTEQQQQRYRHAMHTGCQSKRLELSKQSHACKFNQLFFILIKIKPQERFGNSAQAVYLFFSLTAYMNITCVLHVFSDFCMQRLYSCF